MRTIIAKNFYENESTGMACGPFDIRVICGEIVFEENGNRSYLTGCWVSAAGESVDTYITTEPLAEIMANAMELDDEENKKYHTLRDSGIKAMDDPEYEDLYEALRAMMTEKLIEIGHVDLEEYEDEDEEYELYLD